TVSVSEDRMTWAGMILWHHRAAEIPDKCPGLCHSCLFPAVEIPLHDIMDTGMPDPDRHAKRAFGNPILPVQHCRAGNRIPRIGKKHPYEGDDMVCRPKDRPAFAFDHFHAGIFEFMEDLL